MATSLRNPNDPLRPGQAGASQIPGQAPSLRAPVPADNSLPLGIPNNDFTRNAVNTAMALPGGRVLRGGSMGADLAVQGLRGVQGLSRTQKLGLGARAALSAPVAVPTVGLSMAGAQTPELPQVQLRQPAVDQAPAEAPALRGSLPPGITRTGNTFGNTEDTSLDRVSVVPGLEGLQRQARSNAIRQSMIDEQRGGVSGFRSTTEGNFRGATNEESFARDRERYFIEQGLRSSNRRERAAALDALAGQGNRAAQERIADRRQVAEDANAQADRALRRDLGQAQIDATVRGQDMAAKSASAKAQRDQMNSDRQFQLEVAKYGDAKAKTNYDQRQEAIKQMTDRLSTMLPPGEDGKPDMNAVSRHAQGLNAMLGNRMAALEQELRANPGNQEAAAELKALEERGMSAFDEADVRRFIAGQQAAQIANESDGLAPWSGSAVQSTAPVTSLRRREGLIFDDYVTDRGDVIPARKVDRQGGILGLGGRRNSDFDILKK